MYSNIIEQLKSEAQLRNLSARSIETYSYYVNAFLIHVNKAPESLTCEDVRSYLLERRKSGISASTCNLSNSAIRFLFRRVLHKPWDEDLVPRMIKDQHLPHVLSQEEVFELMNATQNLKHRAMISLMYGSGLRVSEVTGLDYSDISRRNMQVHVRKTKNRIDRYTILSQYSLELLTEYWFSFGKPTGILFPSRYTGTRMAISSVEGFMRKASQKAGFPEPVRPHDLRHTFATHLLESGVDIKYIQALLGHKSPVSTEIYLHISNKNLLGVKSPLDSLGNLR